MNLLEEIKINKGQNERICVIVKVTHNCNLNCPYCYNKNNFLNKEHKIMPIEIFDKTVYNIARNYENGEIVFHGGEPLLAGIEWYKEAFKVINKYKKRFKINLRASIQTNGTLINQEILDLFKQNGIQSFGVSFDGLENDNTRKSTKALLKAINLIKRNDMECGGMMIITKDNIDSLIENFEYFNSLNLPMCGNIVFDSTLMDGDLYSGLNSDHVSQKLCEFFDYYAIHPSPYGGMRYFDNIVSSVSKSKIQETTCTNRVCNYKWICITPDGSAYPCGREWTDEYKMGNVMVSTFKELFDSESYEGYVTDINIKMNKCKNEIKCPLYQYCMGGCPATAYSNTKSPSNISSLECETYKKVFIHIYNSIMVKNISINNRYFLKILSQSKKYREMNPNVNFNEY